MSESCKTEELEEGAMTEVALLDDSPAQEATPLSVEPEADARISMASLPLLLDYFRRGAKPQAEWKCGLEFELFGYDERSLQRLDAAQVQDVLKSLAQADDDLVFENGVVVEARAAHDARITIEPGGQIEFSGAPYSSLSETERDVHEFLSRLGEIATERGFVFLATGFDPLRTIDEQRWYPKPRYSVMRPFLAGRGRRGWDMMTRTCAMQVNLDFDDEADLAKKFILGNRLAPIVTAIFANSPFEHGTPSGYKSTRAAVWLETDAARAGLSPLALDGQAEQFSLNAFVDDALDVPMIFTRRGAVYSPLANGLTFRNFLEGDAETIAPVFHDWTDHLTTIFTEARLKQYIELRSADGGSLKMAMAVQALWKGLLYDAGALDEALRLTPKLNAAEMHALQTSVARDGLAARHADVEVLNNAKEIIKLAALGLSRVAPDEVKYLDVLCEQVIADEVCPADILLLSWHGSWNKSLAHLIEYLRAA
jgi:glutamate--cysteine ligase